MKKILMFASVAVGSLAMSAGCGNQSGLKLSEQYASTNDAIMLMEDIDIDEPMPENRERYTDYGENPFVDAVKQSVSTFSVDCDGASYANMRRYASYGQRLPVESIRVEEFINYFTFDYPEPQTGHNIAVDNEVAQCPWNDEHLLMRVGIKGKTIPNDQLPATNYVFLIDVSGSMDSDDKLGILKTGFSSLVDELQGRDRVAIVVYAGDAGRIT